MNTNSNRKSLVTFATAAAVIAIVVFSGIAIARSSPAKQQAIAQQPSVEGPKATKSLDKEFKFPLVDEKGKELTKINYTIENAELRNQIIVQGQTATAVEGKIFMILTIKIRNEFNRAIDINARDYVRLAVNDNVTELLAADIHNDPVTVQPISTKPTRIGFPVNMTDKKFTLVVGEIKGTKQNIPLQF